MTPQRPYLLRALYEWIVDNNEIPYVLVDATVPGVQVPAEHVVDGQIVLNLSADAVRDLSLGDEFVMCSSRFSGRVFELCLPLMSIKAIYCKDSGHGMVFPEETLHPAAGAEDPAAGKGSAGGDTGGNAAEEEAADKGKKPAGDDKPNLRLV